LVAGAEPKVIGARRADHTLVTSRNVS